MNKRSKISGSSESATARDYSMDASHNVVFLTGANNVKDAYDGILAVTEAFADYQDCLFIVSTHIIEVGKH